MLKSPIIKILSVYVTRSALKSANSSRKSEYGPGGRYRVTIQNEGGGAGVVAIVLFKVVGGFMQIISNVLKVFTDFRLRLKLASYIIATPPPFFETRGICEYAKSGGDASLRGEYSSGFSQVSVRPIRSRLYSDIRSLIKTAFVDRDLMFRSPTFQCGFLAALKVDNPSEKVALSAENLIGGATGEQG